MGDPIRAAPGGPYPTYLRCPRPPRGRSRAPGPIVRHPVAHGPSPGSERQPRGGPATGPAIGAHLRRLETRLPAGLRATGCPGDAQHFCLGSATKSITSWLSDGI